MKTPYPLVLTKQYQNQTPLWLEAIKSDESVSVLFFPKTDRLRRFQQLMDDQELLKKHLGQKLNYIFELVDLSTVNIEDYFDLQDYLTRYLNYERIVPFARRFDECMKYLKKEGLRLVVVLYEAEKYLTPATKKVFGFVSKLVVDNSPHIMVLSLFEIDITHPSLFFMLPTSTSLYDNLFYYPVYNQDEALTFIKYLQIKWNIKIKSETESEIVAKCGGHFWLIKEAMREVVNEGNWSADSEGIQFRLNAIYSSLITSEQSLLNKMASKNKNLNDEEKRSFQYFKKMQLIGKNNQILMPLLQDYGLKQTDLASSLTLIENRTYLNKVPIDKFFSRKEHRILKLLLQNKNEIVSRDKIGNVVWPTNTNENYSDWAIDQTIARIRKRLSELSLAPSLVQVVRGKGYKINLP